MLILERSVTKHFWLKMYRNLFRRIRCGRYDRVGSKHILRVPCGSRTVAYVIVTPHEGDLRPIAWLYLWKKPGFAAWEVMQVFVFEKLRGQGLAKKLYQAAINHDDLIMASGKSQSASSRSLWKSFVKKKMFDVFAIDYKKLSDRSQVFWDDEEQELWCDLNIYHRACEHETRDVRLIATRKK